MPEVREDLVPADGLTASTLKFVGLDRHGRDGDALVRFEIRGADKSLVGVFTVSVRPEPEGTLDAMVAAAHREMADVLRNWLFRVDQARSEYARRGA